jgi:type IV pilus assembly protein PilX
MRAIARVERGFVLISALLFMIVLTIIVISITGTTTVEEKVARNFRDRDIAFAAAEATLRDAELHLNGSWKWPYAPVDINAFNATCDAGLCDSLSARNWQPLDRVDFFSADAIAAFASASPKDKSVPIGSVTGSPDFVVGGATAFTWISDNRPRYMIETLCSQLGSATAVTCTRVYRITAQARGRLASTRVVLQEIYLKSDSVK